MSRVKNATNWLTKLSCVSTFAAPCGHFEAGSTLLGGTSPKIQPAANDFSTPRAEGLSPVSTGAGEHAGATARRPTTGTFRTRGIPTPLSERRKRVAGNRFL